MDLSKFSLSLDPLFINRLLRQESLEKGMRVLRIGLLIFCVLLLISLIREAVSSFLSVSTEVSTLQNAISSAGATSASGKKKIATDYKVLRDNRIFGDFTAKTKPDKDAQKPISTLALNLIGTFMTDGESSYAIIEDDKKKVQDVFNVKDRIFNEATLMKIFADKVEIDRNGKIEILKMDLGPDKGGAGKQTTGISEVGTDEFVVEEGELNAAIENLPLVLTQARAVPYFKDGKSIGLRMFAIRSGSIYEKIGLKNGDILKSVNGQSLADLTQAVKLFEKLKEERSVNVVLERDRQDRDFKYQIR